MTEETPASAGVTTWLVDDQAWEYDEETGGQVAMLVESPTVQAGLWKPGRSGLGPIEVDLDHTEIILVLSGTGQLEVDDAAPLKLTAGRAVRIDAGARTRWVVDQEFSELWLYV
ncbi:MAG: cupin domain-containing protein [Sporichthyaceae bacterium]